MGVALLASGLGGFASSRVNGSGAAAQSAAVPSSAERAQKVRHVAYVRTVAAAVERLDARRTADRRRLLGARRPSDQAAAAQALVAAYQEARLSLPAGESGAIQAGLSAAERAYSRLATAARGANASAWRAARREALQRELEFERALGTLQRS